MARPSNRPEGTFEERCRAAAEAKTAQALKMRPGLERDVLLAEARQMEIANGMNEWLNSPGLRPPT